MRRFLISLMLLSSFLSVPAAHAQLKGSSFSQFLEPTFSGTYQTGGDLKSQLPSAVGTVISLFLSLVGVILLIIVVYAGFLWLTAGGNEDQVGRAKQLIKNGVIGMVIVLAAYLITNFVVTQVQNAVNSSQQQ